ncbi:GTP-binding protein, partial [Paraburkholderia sp. SIMBA_009]
GREARLDGAALAGSGELLLTAAAELELPGLGRLRIEPGGQDLPALKRELADVQAASAALLSRLGVAHVAEAEERHARGVDL